MKRLFGEGRANGRSTHTHTRSHTRTHVKQSAQERRRDAGVFPGVSPEFDRRRQMLSPRVASFLLARGGKERRERERDGDVYIRTVEKTQMPHA